LAITSSNPGYYMSGSGLYVPTNKYKESSSRTIEVSDSSYAYARPNSLEGYINWQLQQSRRKYFIFHEMYRRDTWIRATIDYIVKRATRDQNRLVDIDDPANPDIVDLKKFLDNCYPDGDFEDIYRGIVQDMLEYQQGYVYVERTIGGKPKALWPMDSRITFPITDWHGTILFHVQVYNGAVEKFEKDEILYFPLRNNGSDPKGIPAMETLVESVAMEANANRFNAKLFENNLNIGAIFSVPGATDEDIEDNLRYLEDHYATPENAHRPLMLKNDAKLLRDGALATKDINFELLIKLARHRVCSVFGVPESLLGIPDNTNRATGNVHERQSYVNTVRPIRRMVNRQFTRQFIGPIWGSSSVKLDEPINSLLPTQEELEAVDKAASVGMRYNDILEMMGLPRVPNGDYFVMKGPNGTYQRLDLIAMPGLDDPHFDFEAYQLEHQAQTEQQTQMGTEAAMAGVTLPPSTPATPYVPPRPQEQIQQEAIAARIVDLSRSLDFDLDDDIEGYGLCEIWTSDYVVSRRVPMAPGSRGSTTVYTTSSGKVRYGTPPRPKQAPVEAPDGSPNNNSLTNPRDPNTPKRLTPEERLAMGQAKVQVESLFRMAQQENWTNEQFMDKMEKEGWAKTGETRDEFHDAKDARAEARHLGELYPTNAYTLLGSNGSYFIMEKELSAFDKPTPAPKEQQKRPADRKPKPDHTVGMYKETHDPQTSGSGTGNPTVRKSLLSSDFVKRAMTFAGDKS
jgi:HK97 family phage portal protein